ncbi:AAA family ATPase [Thiohalorhabdus sp. Cl-TMA]|uniref:AAA family ATPase n=1 Tax=Thiohalorhabdus methylotrophus TaxID=3242694 RepID=A0ABV4TSA9_9GAMM
MDAPVRALLQSVNQVLLGKEEAVRLAVAGLLARGHLLIEDLPGVGKTTLAHALSRLLGLDLQRIQFTSDMLPADIVGASVYERETGGFVFHQGPLFAQLVLADEVNRATPKTQSALLEAMGERQVTVEGATRDLPEPFFVIATQNPLSQIGTFPLPESQLDRFLMRLSLGYPDTRAERELLEGEDRATLVQRLTTAMDTDTLDALQRAVPEVHASAALLDYVQALLTHTREVGRFRTGLSPRAGLALLRAAQAWALVDGRQAVLPEDVQAVFPAVAAHRLHPLPSEEGRSSLEHTAAVMDEVAIP